MKMLAASEPEIMENLDSDAMEKLKEETPERNDLESNQTKRPHGPCGVLPGGRAAQVMRLDSLDAPLLLLLGTRNCLISTLAALIA